MPSTELLSPGCSVSRDQPLSSSSIGLSSSIAQLISSGPLFTFMKTWTCGLRQSSSETTPVNVTGFLSSNFASGSWCANTSGADAITSAHTKAEQRTRRRRTRRWLIGLLPPDLEGARAALVVLPRACDDAVSQREVFDLAVDRVADRAACLVLRVGLDVHEPAFGIERGRLDRDVIGARIDRAGDALAVPRHHDDDVVAERLVAGPRAEPRTFERMPFLREGGNGNETDSKHREDQSFHRQYLTSGNRRMLTASALSPRIRADFRFPLRILEVAELGGHSSINSGHLRAGLKTCKVGPIPPGQRPAQPDTGLQRRVVDDVDGALVVGIALTES